MGGEFSAAGRASHPDLSAGPIVAAMRSVWFALALLFVAPLTFAAGWKKPYFGATKSGSWAKYSDVAGDMKMTTVSTRFPDADTGARRIGSRTEFAGNQYPPVVNEYTLADA